MSRKSKNGNGGIFLDGDGCAIRLLFAPVYRVESFVGEVIAEVRGSCKVTRATRVTWKREMGLFLCQASQAGRRRQLDVIRRGSFILQQWANMKQVYWTQAQKDSLDT